MSDLKKPLFTLTIEEYLELTARAVRKAIEEERAREPNPTEQAEDECMTIRQCAEFLNCSLVSIHAYKKKGMPYYRIGRKVLFKKNEILDFMKAELKGKRRVVLEK